jgi:hypothetical protein
MKISLRRRQFVLAATGALAQFGLPRAPFAQSQIVKPGSVPTVDSLTIKVITDSGYDTPRPINNKWIKVTRAPTNSRTDFRKALPTAEIFVYDNNSRDRTVEVAVAELLLLAHVEQDRPAAAVEALAHLVGRDLRHRLPRLVHDLLVGLRHAPQPSTPSNRFMRYSSQRATAPA